MTTVLQSQQIATTRVAAATAPKGQIYGALLVVIAVPVLCIAGNQAGLLRIVFPALSLAVGAFLFMRSKPHYVGLVFCLWFATPFLGRMADFQSGWVPSNAVLLAPYITAGLSGITLMSSLKRLGERGSLPYVCALIAILYGLIIGLVRYPLFNVLQALLNWIVPVIFGFFIYEHRALYPQFRKAIEKSFLFGILVMGAYGIYQFFELPDWDRTWLLNVEVQSFGAVEAMGVRVFSTMNAPAIFAAVTMCGLLILLNLKGRLRIVSAACGFVALMLTISRASWLSLVAGAIFLIARLEMRQRARLAIAVAACALVILALYQIPPIGELIGQRIESFSAPSQDVSYSSRIDGHQQALRALAQEPFGEGLGSTDTDHFTEGDDSIIGPHDSTLLEFLYSLGWIGTLIYGLGLGSLAVQLLRTGREDPFVLSSNAIIIGFAAQSLLNSVMIGVLGFMVWTFASMSLAQAAGVESTTDMPAFKALEPEESQVMA
jgi:O-Antigen ligase